MSMQLTTTDRVNPFQLATNKAGHDTGYKLMSRKEYLEQHLALDKDASKKQLKADYRAHAGSMSQAVKRTGSALLTDANVLGTAIKFRTNKDGERTGFSIVAKYASGSMAGASAEAELKEQRKVNAELQAQILALQNRS